ncbi:hypothetical protein [Aureimonas phyllosphaerae]|uniref:Uncharacterized protein n=1 Tax=Aureimonas phyllosphaerae TaxID=1166078 RepID=A0A7W6BWV6_9HYPH|nr:hypothetical protein [Aureimonas phyllosphaerae]MBB3936145.1 hypothetical protein [Aureimonas phyllosphaerae]MBB3960130.1 hypothetical protein [Aureimonas phyllosphaerae]SFF33579.1 hypothetical protein SAMN05216566_108113 [Aureimonas phyllosphaerae]
MTARASSLARGVLIVAAALSLAACNPTAGKRTGSGDGPTNSAGSSNTPGQAVNGGPAAE